MQAALGAGQKEQASNALQGWLHSLAGGADAAMALGGGGRVNVKELQAELLVSLPMVLPCSFCSTHPQHTMWHVAVSRK